MPSREIKCSNAIEPILLLNRLFVDTRDYGRKLIQVRGVSYVTWLVFSSILLLSCLIHSPSARNCILDSLRTFIFCVSGTMVSVSVGISNKSIKARPRLFKLWRRSFQNYGHPPQSSCRKCARMKWFKRYVCLQLLCFSSVPTLRAALTFTYCSLLFIWVFLCPYRS